jgi:UDP-glucuronate 4-epimerase
MSQEFASTGETVLVTGAAGFIGSNLCQELLAQGFRVVGVDNFDDTYPRAFKEEHLVSCKEHSHFELVELDICDREALLALAKRVTPTYIVHLAAKADTRVAVDEPLPYVDTNITGTLNVFDASREVGVKNIVSASSSSVYGNDEHIPWKETSSADHPISPYGATKRAGELFAYAYHHNFGLNITCLRFFNVYGENNRPGMVPYKWTRALLLGEEIEMSGGGTRKRDYTYIGDIIAGVTVAMRKPLGYEIINLGNSSPLSLKELLSVLEQATGVAGKVKERPSHKASVEETYADISKAKELLGWEPKTSTADGMARLVAWMRAHRLEESK